MADHIMSKTAEAVALEKWRLKPIGDKTALTSGEEALANIMGQQSRFLLDKIAVLQAKVDKLDKASHGE